MEIWTLQGPDFIFQTKAMLITLAVLETTQQLFKLAADFDLKFIWAVCPT